LIAQRRGTTAKVVCDSLAIERDLQSNHAQIQVCINEANIAPQVQYQRPSDHTARHRQSCLLSIIHYYRCLISPASNIRYMPVIKPGCALSQVRDWPDGIRWLGRGFSRTQRDECHLNKELQPQLPPISARHGPPDLPSNGNCS
jgi:hypothetical protein